MRSRPRQDWAYSPTGAGAVDSVAPAACDRRERIDVAGRESHDARAAVPVGDERGQVHVHGPGDARGRRAELLTDQEYDVGGVGQGRQCAGASRSAAMVWTPAASRWGAAVRRWRNGRRRSPWPSCRPARRPPGQPGQRRPHLARHAQDEHIPLEPAHAGDEFGEGAVITSSSWQTDVIVSGQFIGIAPLF